MELVEGAADRKIDQVAPVRQCSQRRSAVDDFNEADTNGTASLILMQIKERVSKFRLNRRGKDEREKAIEVVETGKAVDEEKKYEAKTAG